MEKMVYVAVSARINADEFPLLYTFDIDAARAACHDDWHHLTASEKKRSREYVETYRVEAANGETAKDALFRLFDDSFCVDPETTEILY